MFSSQSSRQSLETGRPRIAVVGVCGSGKSTLVAGLRELGFNARQVSQEHSNVRYLWNYLWQPDILIYLDATDATVEKRIGPLAHKSIIPRQRERLTEAREQATIYIATDSQSVEEVLSTAVAEIKWHWPASGNSPLPGESP